MDDFKNIDKAFKDALGDFKPKLNADAWQGVNAAIVSEKLAATQLLNKRLMYLTAALGGLLGLGIWWYFMIPADGLNKTQISNATAVEAINSIDLIASQAPDTLFIEKIRVDTVFMTQYLNRYIKEQKNKQITIDEILANKELKEALVLAFRNENNANTDALAIDQKEHISEIDKKEVEAVIDWNTIAIIDYGQLKTRTPRARGIKFVKNPYEKNIKVKEKIPLEERLSIAGLISGNTGKLMSKNQRSSTNNFHGNSFSVNADLALTNKLWLRTGLQLDQNEFHLNGNSRISVQAESVNGLYQYVFRSPLGNLIIPNDQLSTPAQSGSKVELESHNDNYNRLLTIPFQLNYNVLAKNVKFLHYYRNIYAYTGVSGYLQHPLKSTVSLEVYEQDGNEFDLDINKFKGVSNLSFGGSILAGLKVSLKPSFYLTTEASYRRNLTYYVNNEYYQSYPKQYSLTFGLIKKLK